MTLSSRLSSYASLALAPVAVTSAAVADTYTGSSTGPVTVVANPTSNLPEVNLFTAEGINMKIFAFNANSGGFRSGGLVMRSNATTARIALFDQSTQSITINGTTGAETVNGWGGGWDSEWPSSWNGRGIMQPGVGYMGFSYLEGTNDRVNGFIHYDLSVTSTSVELTILSWAYNVGSAITMPANTGGGGAVPGLGGLAALAMGASGVRRKRSRVA